MTDADRALVFRVNDLSQGARASWISLLVFIGFVGVTLVAVRDADFFVPSRETLLPIVAVRIPTASFFWFAPVLAAALYVHLHLHLLKLWDAVAAAPAVIDGAPLGDHLHAWFATDLALHFKGRDAVRHRPLDWLNNLVTVILVWIAAPLAVAGFWIRSMPAHDQYLSLLIAASLLAMIYAGTMSWLHARLRIREPWRRAIDGPLSVSLAIVLALILGAFTYLRTEYDLALDRTTPLVGPLLGTAALSTLTQAQLDEVELVKLPATWRDFDAARLAYRDDWCATEQIPDLACGPRDPDTPLLPNVLAARAEWCAQTGQGPGAPCAATFARLDAAFDSDWTLERATSRYTLGVLDLSHRDLRGAHAVDTTLVGADFTGARLDNADLTGALLEGAYLDDASLAGVTLRIADLRVASATEANFSGADLREARLDAAMLAGINLAGADLTRARLDDAYMLNSNFRGADLGGAWLDGVDVTVSDFTGADLRGAKLRGADLRGADLARADLRWSDLSGARWSGATTGAALAQYADLRDAPDLTQGQLDGMIGNAGTLLPDTPAPDTGRPYAIPACWPAPPADFDDLLARVTRDNPADAPRLRGTLLCGDGPARMTGTPCAAGAAPAACAAP